MCKIHVHCVCFSFHLCLKQSFIDLKFLIGIYFNYKKNFSIKKKKIGNSSQNGCWVYLVHPQAFTIVAANWDYSDLQLANPGNIGMNTHMGGGGGHQFDKISTCRKR